MADESDGDYAHTPPNQQNAYGNSVAPKKRFNLAWARSKAARMAREGKGEGAGLSGYHGPSSDAGEEARAAGQPRDANPHPPGSLKHRSWDFGWGPE